MEDLATQLSARNHLMRHMARLLTPEQRIARCRQMHEWGMRQLRNNPDGWARFIRRNLRKRAVDPRQVP
jgi:hypothetical protein